MKPFVKIEGTFTTIPLGIHRADAFLSEIHKTMSPRKASPFFGVEYTLSQVKDGVGKTVYQVSLFGMGEYDEGELFEFLSTVTFWLAEGEIRFLSTSGCNPVLWRIQLRGYHWYKDEAEIVYVNGTDPVV